jgi:nicotinate-nucleotide pyrophosphorylase (carboxylating)
VRCGGGRSHRLALHDAVLIKDNHLSGVALGELAGVVERAARDARRLRPDLAFFEVEVESLDQLDRLLALPAGVIDVILLDNMGPVQLRSAVARRERAGSRVELESSGGVRLDTVRQIAETGVERISAGALTHGATWLDVAMDMHA